MTSACIHTFFLSFFLSHIQVHILIHICSYNFMPAHIEKFRLIYTNTYYSFSVSLLMIINGSRVIPLALKLLITIGKGH